MITSRVGVWLALAALATAGCSCGDSDEEVAEGKGGGGGAAATGGGGLGGGIATGGGGGVGPGCLNLECQQVACGPGTSTTLAGTVYDPSGSLPLYNVTVYVPNAEVGPIADELICDQCDAELSGSPLVTALTDTQGRFVLDDVPVGNDIPLVIQVGKWRRMVSVPSVEACVENTLTDVDMTRLPRSRAEGNLPRIALSTGRADPLFCLLRRIGIDNSEFGIEGSDARVHFYRGQPNASGAMPTVRFDDGFGKSPGANFTIARDTLWVDGWQSYDIVLLSCEGSESASDKHGLRVNLRDYLNAGGRVFATHYHYSWVRPSGSLPAGEPPDLASIATFTGTQSAFNGLVEIDETFPKGAALAEWLSYFGDPAQAKGQFHVNNARRHTTSLDENLARRWVYRGPDSTLDVERNIYFSFNAPIAVAEEDQCGRMVVSDIHVSGGTTTGPFPSACSTDPLSEQEKVLIFMLFDLSACIQPDVPGPPR
jgi:hypothetical protein